MNILFIHQSFPGQYRHVINALSAENCHTIVALGVSSLAESLPNNVQYFQYRLLRSNTPGLHGSLLDIDSKFIRGESCATAANSLRLQGFSPDIICAHPGWGEALFLSDVWPRVPVLCYQEFYYHAYGFDHNFDSEIQPPSDWQDCARLRLKNANPLLMLQSSAWNVTPTQFQLSSFPSEYHHKFSVIHDGVDTSVACPNPFVSSLRLSDGTVLNSESQVITFVNRHIEPYRGCHTVIRSIPLIQKVLPAAHIVIVGAKDGVGYGKAPPHTSWLETFLPDIEGDYDPSLVHFTGSIPYNSYLHLLQISSCHLYFTYPFVLSWSMLEAMSCGIPIIGSNTPPVSEVIEHMKTGILTDFFSSDALADAILRIFSDPELSLFLGSNARNYILQNYSIDKCVPRQLELLKSIADKGPFVTT